MDHNFGYYKNFMTKIHGVWVKDILHIKIQEQILSMNQLFTEILVLLVSEWNRVVSKCLVNIW